MDTQEYRRNLPPRLITPGTEGTYSYCIGPVRWHHGRLQQFYEIIVYKNGSVASSRDEWRDVEE